MTDDLRRAWLVISAGRCACCNPQLTGRMRRRLARRRLAARDRREWRAE